MNSNNSLTIDISGLIEEKNTELKEMPIFSDDFDATRFNVLNIIEKGNEALEDFAELAKQSGHPKSYEALASLMKTVLEANRTLLDLHHSSKKFIGESKPGNKGGIVQNGQSGNTNIIMVGTTKDLLAMLSKKEESEDV